MSLTARIPRLHAFALKCCALIVGYALWHTLSKHYKIETTVALPLSFYNQRGTTIQAPETVRVKVYASRKQIFKTVENAAIHYDASSLPHGTSTITISPEHIFLPDSVSLLHSLPTNIKVTVT